jgi:hypothetical protein
MQPVAIVVPCPIPELRDMPVSTQTIQSTFQNAGHPPPKLKAIKLAYLTHQNAQAIPVIK